jgi:hypothetical protein
VDEKTLRITPPDGPLGLRKSVSAVDDKIFSFDKVFPQECTQELIYQSVSTHVKATVRGYNTTIFAYGSTGSGKSYSMTGNSSAPGIIPRAISEIFSIIEATAAQENDVFFYVRLSYVELYNNNFRNLLEFASKELALKEKNNERYMALLIASTLSISFASLVTNCLHRCKFVVYYMYTHQYIYLYKRDEMEGGSNTSVSRDKERSTSPTQMHPGLAHRTDKIEV